MRPDSLKLSDLKLLNGQAEHLRLAQEGINDDSDKQVEEDLHADELEELEEEVGGYSAPAREGLPTILLHTLIILVLPALEVE